MLDALTVVGKNLTLQCRTLGRFVQTAFFEDQDAHQHFPMAHSAHTCVRMCPQGLTYQHNILSSTRTWKERPEAWSPWALEAHLMTMIPCKSFTWNVNKPLENKEGNVTSNRCVIWVAITVGDWSLLTPGKLWEPMSNTQVHYLLHPTPHFPLGMDGRLFLCNKEHSGWHLEGGGQ